ncbi:hypothetical protein CSAL01_06919 [Colletotrichum salicis]|uniref:Secreted protein n=1 Tax=Colletotrichum salicis TaxID=1209931 RepID=A0A135TA06_9PEZI|nr:hypothetical protein CSAL01_06919 [Colletotrichum salicis]
MLPATAASTMLLAWMHAVKAAFVAVEDRCAYWTSSDQTRSLEFAGDGYVRKDSVKDKVLLASPTAPSRNDANIAGVLDPTERMGGEITCASLLLALLTWNPCRTPHYHRVALILLRQQHRPDGSRNDCGESTRTCTQQSRNKRPKLLPRPKLPSTARLVFFSFHLKNVAESITLLFEPHNWLQSLPVHPPPFSQIDWLSNPTIVIDTERFRLAQANDPRHPSAQTPRPSPDIF